MLRRQPLAGGAGGTTSLLHGAGLLVLGSGVGRVALLGATLLVARTLGAESFGTLVLVQTTVATAAVLSGTALGIAVAKLVGEQRGAGHQDVSAVIAGSLRLTGALAAAVTLLLLAAAAPIARLVLDHPELSGLLRLSAALLLLSSLSAQAVACLNAGEANREAGLSNALRGLTQAAALLAGAQLAGVSGGIVGLAAAEAVTLAYAVHQLWRSGLLTSRRDTARRPWTGLGPLVRLALPVTLAALTVQPALWLGQLVLLKEGGGLAALGVFGVALRWNAVVMFVPTALAPLAVPRMARARATGDAGRLRRVFAVNAALTLVPVAVLAIAVSAGAPFLLDLQGSEYAGQWEATAIMAVVALLMTTNNALTQVALSAGRVRAAVLSDAALGAALVASVFVLVPSQGAAGLAIAYAFAYLASCLAVLPAAWSVLMGRGDDLSSPALSAR